MSQVSVVSSGEWKAMEDEFAKLEKAGSAAGASLWKQSPDLDIAAYERKQEEADAEAKASAGDEMDTDADPEAMPQPEQPDEDNPEPTPAIGEGSAAVAAAAPGRQTRRSIGAVGQNFQFLTNAIPSKPKGGLITFIHRNWYYDYDLLEEHHGYIQWLFPVFEGTGMNSMSSQLTKAEARLIRRDLTAAFRFIQNYRMMLNFYGMVLLDEATGKVGRHPDIWESRYQNCVQHPHNFLRINRILTCLGHLGFHKWRKPLLQHLEHEVYTTKELDYCKSSYERFWKKTIEVNTREFADKTLEEPEDREDSVFFHHLNTLTKEYKIFKRMQAELDIDLEETKQKANDADIKRYQQSRQAADRRRQKQIEANRGGSNRQTGGKNVGNNRRDRDETEEDEESRLPNSPAKRPKLTQSAPARGGHSKQNDFRRGKK